MQRVRSESRALCGPRPMTNTTLGQSYTTYSDAFDVIPLEGQKPSRLDMDSTIGQPEIAQRTIGGSERGGDVALKDLSPGGSSTSPET